MDVDKEYEVIGGEMYRMEKTDAAGVKYFSKVPWLKETEPVKSKIKQNRIKSKEHEMDEESRRIWDEVVKAHKDKILILPDIKKIRILHGSWKLEKSKTRFLQFEYKNRLITLAGRNQDGRIDVGYSVYCNNALNPEEPKKPEDEVRSKNIAVGRMEKHPIYTVYISQDTHMFIDASLNVARTEILKENIIIKGIR